MEKIAVRHFSIDRNFTSNWNNVYNIQIYNVVLSISKDITLSRLYFKQKVQSL